MYANARPASTKNISSGGISCQSKPGLDLIAEFNHPYLLNDDKEKQVTVRLGIKPNDILRKQLANMSSNQGVDVCIVLDASQSMNIIVDETGMEFTGETIIGENGQTLNLVRGGTSRLGVAVASAKKVVSMIRECDTISCIKYEDMPTVVFQNCTHIDKQYMLGKLDEVLEECGRGNTNITGALRQAKSILVSNKNMKPKKIIFLTDGEPTVDTEIDGIREGRTLANCDISIDCLGFGEEVNLSYLEQVAAPSCGRTNVIEQPYQAEKMFTSMFAQSQDIIITNAKLKLWFSTSVRVSEHYRGTPENGYLGKVRLDENREYLLNLGQIERNQLYNYYFTLTVSEQKDYVGTLRIMKAELEYYIPTLHGQEKMIVPSCNITVVFGSDELRATTVNADVEVELLLAEVKRLECEAQEARSKNEPEKVVARYKSIMNIYKKLHKPTEAKAYEEILNEYLQTGKISLAALNRATNSSSKAGSAGLLDEDLSEEEYGQAHAEVGLSISRGRNR